MPKLGLHYWVDGNDLDEAFCEVEISQKEYDDFCAFETEDEICSQEWRMICEFIARSVILLDINDIPISLCLIEGRKEMVVFEF
jgi:hypothetical protein